MAELCTSDTPAACLVGTFSVWKVPAEVPYEEVLDKLGTPLLEAKNLVVGNALHALVQLLRGNTEDYTPAYITIGSGGDLDQLFRLDQGARVPASISDTYVRRPEARIPIILTEDGDKPNVWHYVAVARPHEALTPVINELGVETRNGTLISHYISEEDTTGRATRYIKTSLEYLIIKWRYELTLALNTVGTTFTPVSGVYLPFTLADGTIITTVLVEPRPGASTTRAMYFQLSNGTVGTVDIQNNGTLSFTLSDGTPTTIEIETP